MPVVWLLILQLRPAKPAAFAPAEQIGNIKLKQTALPASRDQLKGCHNVILILHTFLPFVKGVCKLPLHFYIPDKFAKFAFFLLAFMINRSSELCLRADFYHRGRITVMADTIIAGISPAG